jgi:1,4-alpha-glucan branching enzyme
VEVPGAAIGDEYQFVIHNGAQELWHKNPYASEVVNSSGNAIIHDPDFDWTGEDFVMPPRNELVIYEMHIGSFNDSASAGPGTFDEIVPKLGYLRDLGINAVEIMPVMEFPMSFSWGYNPSDPFAVESALGGPQGLQRFVKAAHALGIAVIMDVVYNHFGPGDLDLWCFDGWSDENHKGGIYFYDNDRSHTPWGDTRPDYGRPEVRQYLRDNALFWLNKYRLDGLRFDSVSNIRGVDGRDLPDGWSILQWIHNEIRSMQPWKITIAEDLQNNEWITKETNVGGAGFGSQWDAGFVHPIRDAVIAPSDADRDLYAVCDALYHRYNGDAEQRVIYTESHDEVANGHARVPEEIWPGNAGSWFSRKRSTLGAALVFTAPGIPMIFQGQEFLEDQYFRDSAPLDWAKLDTYAGINALYRDLIRLRRNWFNQTGGLRGQQINVHHVNNTDKVIAFHRWENGGPGDDVVIVANFGNRSYDSYALGFPRAGDWRVRFNSDWQGYSSDFGNQLGYDTFAGDGSRDGMPFEANVGLGPYSVLILSQDSP